MVFIETRSDGSENMPTRMDYIFRVILPLRDSKITVLQ